MTEYYHTLLEKGGRLLRRRWMSSSFAWPCSVGKCRKTSQPTPRTSWSVFGNTPMVRNS